MNLNEWRAKKNQKLRWKGKYKLKRILEDSHMKAKSDTIMNSETLTKQKLRQLNPPNQKHVFGNIMIIVLPMSLHF